MSRVSFIFRTDTHTADKAPVSWKGDYRSEILTSLVQIGELAREYKVDAVLDGGDFFHVKAASRNSHALLVDVVGIHNNYPCRTWSVEGNHDITGNNLDTVEQQPLGVLYETQVFRHLREEVFESGSLKVRVVGLPYDPTRDLRAVQEVRKKFGDTHLIVVMHALAGENPPSHVEEFFGEPVFKYGTLVYDNGPDIFCFGHWHKDQGIVQIGDVHFVNQGAVSRGALTKDNLDRIPQVALIEITEDGVITKALPLNVAPASDVYDLGRKERQDKETLEIGNFIEQLENDTQLEAGHDIELSVQTANVALEVQTRALKYLEEARS